MTNSKTAKPDRPKKPRRDFPLFPHATKRWAKKIRGKFHYFGPWDDPIGAEAKYNELKDDLHAGRRPRSLNGETQVRDVLNHFLNAKRDLRDSGELAARTWADYFATCERIRDKFKPDTLVVDLRAEDFNSYRAAIAKVWGHIRVGNEVQRVRTIFKLAYDDGLIGQPVRFGSTFKKPSRKVMRKERAERGLRMFEAIELSKLLEAADQPMKAMILLGVNCGYGNADIAALELRHLDLAAGWSTFPRPKTGIDRRCALWPETIAALRDWIKRRPMPKDAAHKTRVFITKYGHTWDKAAHEIEVQEPDAKEPAKPKAINSNPVALQFRKLLDALKLRQPGRGYYSLRHTTETIGGACRDQVAVNMVMGHADESMAAVYRERIDDDRLKLVAETIHEWLYDKRKCK